MKKLLGIFVLGTILAVSASASWSNNISVSKVSWANSGVLKLKMSDAHTYYWIHSDAEDYKQKLATALTLVTSGIKVNIEHSTSAIRKLEIGQ